MHSLAVNVICFFTGGFLMAGFLAWCQTADHERRQFTTEEEQDIDAVFASFECRNRFEMTRRVSLN